MKKFVKLAAVAVVLSQVVLLTACCGSCKKPEPAMEKMNYDYSK